MIKTVGRRQFLVGSTCTLAIPLLGSLLPRTAEAAACAQAPLRFVTMWTGHGGVWRQNMYPADAVYDQQMALYPGHDIHYGALQREVQDGLARLSPVLEASDATLTDTLVGKMMVLNGFDISQYMGHHTGGTLGNYGQKTTDNGNVSRPTIDQVMAYSSSFYPDLSTVKKRSMHIGTNKHGALSFGYANPNDPSSGVIEVPVANKSLELFNEIFVPPDDGEPTRPLMVDRVIESYRRLTKGTFGHAARLSSSDRQRLEAHIERLYEVQRRLNVQASCENVAVPTEEADSYPNGAYGTDLSGMGQHYSLYNDVVIAAFACGTSRIAIYKATEKFSNDVAPGDWHDLVAHQAQDNQVAQDTLVESKRYFFEHAFLDLVSKMDGVVDADGNTMLDNSLAMWTQESGNLTHHSICIPVITAGSAGGFFKPGHAVDFRNRASNALIKSTTAGEALERKPGILYNRWLANVLQSMCITPDEYETNGTPGYGDVIRQVNGGFNAEACWPDRVYADASDPLPIIT